MPCALTLPSDANTPPSGLARLTAVGGLRENQEGNVMEVEFGDTFADAMMFWH